VLEALTSPFSFSMLDYTVYQRLKNKARKKTGSKRINLFNGDTENKEICKFSWWWWCW
jgi:hypothetical protein